MPVPKRKHSKARRDSRSACKFIRPKAVTACAQCSHPVSPHMVCPDCGFYKGRKIMTTKLERTLKRTEVAQKAKMRTQAAHAAGAGGHTEGGEPAHEK